MSTLFQYCPKLVIFDKKFSSVLLCQRKWEADFDQTYSFAWWKVETSDGDIWTGMQREKNEELGTQCRIQLYKDFCSFAYYVKKDGNHMILPHHLCVFLEGIIELSSEYSQYQRVPVNELEGSSLSLIPSVPPMVHKMLWFTTNLALSESIIL